MKTNANKRSEFAKDMQNEWDNFQEKLEGAKNLGLPASLQESVNQSLRKNFENQISKIKGNPEYKEAEKTHKAEIKAKVELKKAEKMEKDALIKYEKSKLQTKQKNEEYEQARIDHFGKPTEIKEDKKKEEVDTITSNNGNMSQNEAQNIIENNTQVKIDKWSIDGDQKETRLEGLQKELKKIREKISELENNNGGQRFIDKYKELENATIDLINQIKSPTAPDTKIKDSMEIKSLQKSLSSIRHCIDINHKLKTGDMYYLNMLEATEEKIIKELQNMGIIVEARKKTNNNSEAITINEYKVQPGYNNGYNKTHAEKIIYDSWGHEYRWRNGKLVQAAPQKYNTELGMGGEVYRMNSNL